MCCKISHQSVTCYSLFHSLVFLRATSHLRRARGRSLSFGSLMKDGRIASAFQKSLQTSMALSWMTLRRMRWFGRTWAMGQIDALRFMHCSPDGINSMLLALFPVVWSRCPRISPLPLEVWQGHWLPASDAPPLLPHWPHLQSYHRVCDEDHGREIRHSAHHQLWVHLWAEHTPFTHCLHPESWIWPWKWPHEAGRKVRLWH